MICPCRGCVPPKRCVGCHSTCEAFLEWQKKHEEDKNLERKQILKEYLGNSWRDNKYATKPKNRKK